MFSPFEKTSATGYIYMYILWGICCWHLNKNNSDSCQFMFLLFGSKIQHYLRRKSSLIFCFLLRIRVLGSRMFFLISFWPWMCLFLVSLQISSQKHKVKTPFTSDLELWTWKSLPCQFLWTTASKSSNDSFPGKMLLLISLLLLHFCPSQNNSCFLFCFLLPSTSLCLIFDCKFVLE